jgi:hypothetical protein
MQRSRETIYYPALQLVSPYKIDTNRMNAHFPLEPVKLSFDNLQHQLVGNKAYPTSAIRSINQRCKLRFSPDG